MEGMKFDYYTNPDFLKAKYTYLYSLINIRYLRFLIFTLSMKIELFNIIRMFRMENPYMDENIRTNENGKLGCVLVF